MFVVEVFENLTGHRLVLGTPGSAALWELSQETTQGACLPLICNRLPDLFSELQFQVISTPHAYHQLCTGVVHCYQEQQDGHFSVVTVSETDTET